MERLNKFGVMPVRGEDPQNILEFADVFGVDFGAAATVRQNMGARHRQAENAGVICVRFKTGNLTETKIGFVIKLGIEARIILKGVWSQVISKTPWAHLGDADNVIEGENTMTFLSGDGKDPRAGSTYQGYVAKPGGGYEMGEIAHVARPDGGLKPDTVYYLTQRAIRETGNITPINIMYVGTDDAEHGGERLIENTDFIESGVGIPFSLGNLTGVFIPD